jgi:multicomponent Na+:H+ antiporter subunit G
MKLIIAYVFLGVGLLFDLFGCIGLVRLPDAYLRLMGATKCVTLGTWLILISTVFVGDAAVAAKVVLCVLFIMIAAPTSAHALARASVIAGIKLWDGSVCDKLSEDREKK